MFQCCWSNSPKRESLEYSARLNDYGPLANTITNNKTLLIKSKQFFEDRLENLTEYTETLNTFQLIDIIGAGGFSKVVLAKHLENKKYYAIKCLEKRFLVKQKYVKLMYSERLILEGLNFPFAVYLVSFFKDNSFLYFVLPFVEGGDLFYYLKTAKRFDEPQAKFYSSQIVLALEYLHYLGIVHRDLKPENVLMDHLGYLKIGDFGFSKRIGVSGRTYTLCGTPEYMAPEMIEGKGYGMAIDWWALGVFIFEIASGRTPFYHRRSGDMFQSITQCSYIIDTEFSDELQDLIRNLLQLDLSRRFGNLKNGVDDIKNHIWFRPTHWLAILNRTAASPFKPPPRFQLESTEESQNMIMKLLVVESKDMFAEEFANFR